MYSLVNFNLRDYIRIIKYSGEYLKEIEIIYYNILVYHIFIYSHLHII